MNLTVAEIISTVMAVGALGVSAYTAWLQNRKINNEQPKLNAEITDLQTGTSLDLVVALRKEVEALRADVKALKDENIQLKKELDELEDIREWAKELARQVISLGGTPIEFKTTK